MNNPHDLPLSAPQAGIGLLEGHTLGCAKRAHDIDGRPVLMRHYACTCGAGCPHGDTLCPCQDGDPCHHEPLAAPPALLRPLIDKWRDRAAAHKYCDHSVAVCRYTHKIYQLCADELDAALAAVSREIRPQTNDEKDDEDQSRGDAGQSNTPRSGSTAAGNELAPTKGQ